MQHSSIILSFPKNTNQTKPPQQKKPNNKKQAILNTVFVFLTPLGKVQVENKYFKICVLESLHSVYGNK